jgi:hypothetical protein
MIAEARYYARMLRGCRDFLRTPAIADPATAIRERLANRENGFLHLMRRVVFANPANPYYALFQWAGCELGDLEGGLRRDGLDATLDRLRTAGVRLTNDEFKGRKPIERGGRGIEARTTDFANPLVKGAFENTSSGSRSGGTITRPSVEYQLYREAQDGLFMGQFLEPRRVIGAVLPILPSSVWLHRALSCYRQGHAIEKWFASGGTWRESGHYKILTHLLVAEAQLLGARIQGPEYLPHNDFSPVADWIAARRAAGEPALISSPVSLGVRVAAAALESRTDIAGTLFLCGAEPLTHARRAVMERAGGIVYMRYGISELGWVGCSCLQMKTGSCVHVMRDSVAVVSYLRQAPISEIEVESLLITTLLPSAAYVLVNLEVDDCGKLEDARCDCMFKAMGFTQQISDIYSFGKLTGHGITLLGGDLLKILEVSLPARFGGTPIDYQLVELDDSSRAVVELRVHPRLGVTSGQDVLAYFLGEIRRLWGGSSTYRQWSETDAVRIAFAQPYVSGGRKVNPLHLLGPSPRKG